MKQQLTLQADRSTAVSPVAGKIKQGKPKGTIAPKFQELLQRVDAKGGLAARQAKAPEQHTPDKDSASLAMLEQVMVDKQERATLPADCDEQEPAEPARAEETVAPTSMPAATDLMFLSIAAAHSMHKAFAAPPETRSQATAEPEHYIADEVNAPGPNVDSQTAGKVEQSRRKGEAVDMPAEPREPVEDTDAQPTATFMMIPVAARPAPEAPLVQREVTLTLTKVETALPPVTSMPHISMPAEHEELTQTTKALASAPVLPDAAPSPAVVKTIHFQLQPEHLGELKVSMHLKGEELRLTVEVTTREAHAALQRDTSYLREVLEKAGYDVAEQSVAVNLRLEPALAQQPTTGGEGFSFTRSNSGEQSFQAAAHGQQQQRQPSRQMDKEQGDAQANRGVQVVSAVRTSTGIYI